MTDQEAPIPTQFSVEWIRGLVAENEKLKDEIFRKRIKYDELWKAYKQAVKGGR